MSITDYFLSLWQKSIINFIKLTTLAEDKKNKIEEQLQDEQLELVSGGGGEKPEPKKPRNKAGGGGIPRSKGQPNAPQTRGI